jgi:dTDP-4-dehydrorhamnose 3,5-epimerase
MTFEALSLAGAFRIVPEPIEDARGFFARTWCRREFAAHGLATDFVQCSVSFNRRAATLRGMHFQRAPYPECKLVRCTAGAIFDVIVDLRAESSSYLKWVSVELSAENRVALYVPAGCAHGFQTLADHTEVSYQISEYHHEEAAGGVRWNDPLFAIDWPPTTADRVISARDASYPDFTR